MKKRPWLIPISALKPGGNQFEFDLDIEELGGTEHEVAENPSFLELAGPVRVELNLVLTGRQVMVGGDVRFESKMKCALCGKEFSREFADQLASELVSLKDDEFEDAGDRSSAERLLEGDFLNLVPVVHDAVHLAIPMAPLCRPDCKGVCPQCGADLNQGPCGCQEQKPAPFSVLKRKNKT